MVNIVKKEKFTAQLAVLSESSVRLAELLQLHPDVPDDIINSITALLNCVSSMCYMFTEIKNQCDEQVAQYQQINSELAEYVNKLLDKIVELDKFVESAKKYPGFQC